MANLQDTDLLAVGRGAATYKATFKDIKDNLPAAPDATEAAKGIVELATAAETTTGTDNTRAVHPAGLKVELDKKADDAPDGASNGTIQYNRQVVTAGSTQTKTWVPAAHAPDASETVKGIVELATAAETTAGTDATRAVHPAGLKVELDKKAPLASPALTGTPTAPTATAGTNNTQIATTAYVDAAVAVEDLWDRNGTEISPKVAGDDVFTSGSVKVGDTTAAPKIELRDDGSATFTGTLTASGTIICDRSATTAPAFRAELNGVNKAYLRADGTYYGTNTTIQSITSERRLKENIIPISSDVAWETIKSVPYYAYNFIGSDPSSVVYGPMADEVPDEMRIATDQTDDVGVIHTYDNGLLQARLYTALRTALTRIEALEAEVTALKGGTTK